MDVLLHLIAGGIVGTSRSWTLCFMAAIGKEVFDFYFKTFASVQMLDMVSTVIGFIMIKMILDKYL